MDDGEDEDWSRPAYLDMLECFESSSSTSMSVVAQSMNGPNMKVSHSRTIVHIDIDCFYAQVEMVRNPALRTKPLGIQQKYLLVTCNYIARSRGVTKLMRITDALQRCPELVIVSGEDLTHYREMSYRITDVGNDSPPACPCGCHQRLLIGSHIAYEMREALRMQLDITSCGGVAHNKLLAKLVGSAHKPNDQTTLFPHMVGSLMGSLTKVTQVPGIGHSTGKKLSSMGITTLTQLIEAPFSMLKEEFGYQTASTMQKLCQGHDEAPVLQSGPPQSISDEDSFRKCSSVQDARLKMKALLCSLLQRLKKDGRQPHTLRLSVRKYSKVHKWTRESRQCGMPDGIQHSLQSDEDAAVSKLLDLCVGLFHKMVDTSQPFHLTLISVCFAMFQSQTRSALNITKFFSPRSAKKGSEKSMSSAESFLETEERNKSKACSQSTIDIPSDLPSTSESEKKNVYVLTEGVTPSVNSKSEGRASPSSHDCRLVPSLPASYTLNMSLSNNAEGVRNSVSEIDHSLVTVSERQGCGTSLIKGEKTAAVSKMPSFFAQKSDTLSLSQPRVRVSQNLPTVDGRDSQVLSGTRPSLDKEVSVDSASSRIPDQQLSLASGDRDVAPSSVPPNIDPLVFAELPSELQQELTNEWRITQHDSMSGSQSASHKPTGIPQESLHTELVGIDQSVFKELPSDIQKEVLQHQKQHKRTLSSPKTQSTLPVKRPRTFETRTKENTGKRRGIQDFFHKK
ncbi:DNA polymerase iota-like isoform X2 [Acanthaster planci]|uniref:DNA polymerase iota-like isoform X2 n=1 Tax=Acanthaster planci TaxID=133434 RepID=A0A8B7ZPY2_ACAPL|nr:DNA polymerase iota-like isoform X2 [Acanthaster planci]